MAWNFSEEVWIDGNKLITTRMKLPLWCTSDVINSIFKKPIVYVGKFKVKYIDKDFEDVVADMLAVEWTDTIYQDIDTEKIFPIIQKNISIDNNEILEWMQHAYAGNIAIGVMQANVMNGEGYVLGKSGDGYMPGVEVQDVSYVSEPGNVVGNRGYAKVKTPYGIVNSPVIDKLTIIKQKLLAWSAIPWVGLKQWIGTLLKWLRIPCSPIRNVHIPNINIRGITSPQFIGHIPPHFGFKNIVYMSIASNKDQKLVLHYRDPRDYTQEYFRVVIPLRQNTIARVKLAIRSLFGVPPFLVQFESPDNGLFDIQQYEVKSSLIPL